MKTRTMSKSFVYGLVVSGILFTGAARAQGTNTVSGFVFAADRSPLSAIYVELEDEFYRSVARTKTDGAGRYLFPRVSAGRFYIKVKTLGTDYLEQTAEIEIVNISRNIGGRPGVSGTENVQRDFFLRGKKTTPTQSVTGVVFAQDVPPSAKKLFDDAEDDLKDQKKQLAGIDKLIAAIGIYSDYYDALDKLAAEYVKIGSYEKAADTAKHAVSINPRGFSPWYSLGYSAFQLNQAENAIVALDKAIEINPTSVNAHFVRGVSMRRMSRYTESEASLLKAKSLAKVAVPEIHWQLALLYTNNLKNYLAAIKELELYLMANPSNAEVDKVNDLIKKLKGKAKG